MPSSEKLNETALELAERLRFLKKKVVFAESCTGGLVSATMTQIAGISDFHCGSAVVYRLETKAEWLGVSREKLQDPGPVSAIVAEQMADGVLNNTPEADIAVSVTGHLGPDAPENQDGLIYIGVAARLPGPEGSTLSSASYILSKTSDGNSLSLRDFRQTEAAVQVLKTATGALCS